jgi:hypothetical protein
VNPLPAAFAAPARVQTPIQLPAVLFEGNTSTVVLVVPASLLACCTSVMVELAETAKTVSQAWATVEFVLLCPPSPQKQSGSG